MKFERVFGNSYSKILLRETFFNKKEFEMNKIHKNNELETLRNWRLLLFYGPPGVGKTMLMKTLSSQTERTVFWVSITRLISKFSGESEKMVEVLFDMAREY